MEGLKFSKLCSDIVQIRELTLTGDQFHCWTFVPTISILESLGKCSEILIACVTESELVVAITPYYPQLSVIPGEEREENSQ